MGLGKEGKKNNQRAAEPGEAAEVNVQQQTDDSLVSNLGHLIGLWNLYPPDAKCCWWAEGPIATPSITQHFQQAWRSCQSMHIATDRQRNGKWSYSSYCALRFISSRRKVLPMGADHSPNPADEGPLLPPALPSATPRLWKNRGITANAHPNKCQKVNHQVDDAGLYRQSKQNHCLTMRAAESR